MDDYRSNSRKDNPRDYKSKRDLRRYFFGKREKLEKTLDTPDEPATKEVTKLTASWVFESFGGNILRSIFPFINNYF